MSGPVIGGKDTAGSRSPTHGELPFQCGKEGIMSRVRKMLIKVIE